MTAREREARMMEEVRAACARPSLIHLTCEVLVHEGAAPGARPCPCCGVEFARIAERIPDGEVLIDRETGRRFLPRDLSPATWKRAVAQAEHHDISFRCSRDQLPLLLNNSDQHILVAGSHRSGKTTAGLYWLARQIIRRGGPLKRFWLVAGTQEHAFALLGKLFEGDGRTPGVLPAALAITRPAKHSSRSLDTVLADGTVIQLRHFQGQTTAGALKSVPIVAGLVDEAAELRHESALAALTGRCVDENGRLWLATTPVAGSFLKEKIVDQVAEWERLPATHPDRIAGSHQGARWVSASLSMQANPWVDPERVRKDMAAMHPDDPAFRRDFLGEWVSGAGRLWRFDPEAQVFVAEERRVQDMRGAVDRIAGCKQVRVTADVARRIFQTRTNPHVRGQKASNTAYLLGADVNRSPMVSIVCEVTADAADPQDRERWHVWVIDHVYTYKGHSLAHVQRLASERWARTWAPHVNESPYKGCGIILDPTSFGRDPTADAWGGDPRGIAKLFADHGFDARGPQYRVDAGGWHALHIPRYDSHLLLHRLIDEKRLHVSARAHLLTTSLCEQEADKNGVVPLTTSHTKSDVLANPVDGLRYLCHAIFHSDRARTAVDPSKD
jgi:hypothetical protein